MLRGTLMETTQQNKIKEDNFKKLNIKNVPELSGLELIKHVESKATARS